MIASLLLSVALSADPGGADARSLRTAPTAEPARAGWVPATLVGTVALPDGAPAAGALVSASSGERTVATPTGEFSLEVRLSDGADRVVITARPTGPGVQTRLSTSVTTYPPPYASLWLGSLVLETGSGCVERWTPTFGGEPTVDDVVVELIEFDDGTGPALYAAGTFARAGGAPVGRIAKWTGTRWESLGSGIGISKLFGGGAEVFHLEVFDDGTGPALYAAGNFTRAGGIIANNIAKWDGENWSGLGEGLNDEVTSLAVWDDGTGSKLVVSGRFDASGQQPLDHLATWDGAAWEEVGGGLLGATPQSTYASAMAAFDDGGGEELYVFGSFNGVGPFDTSGMAKWDGQSWSVVDPGFSAGGSAFDLVVFDDGSGSALYLAGSFNSIGSVFSPGVARWDGTSWSALNTGLSLDVYDLEVFDAGTGPQLYATGRFQFVDGIQLDRLARWNGDRWLPVGQGLSFPAYALCAVVGGSEPGLVVGGSYSVNGVPLENIARWTGSRWAPFGTGPDGSVDALMPVDLGSGEVLFAAGSFRYVGGVERRGVGVWDGDAWSTIGTGVGLIGAARTAAVHDDGSGAALYLGGGFTFVDNQFMPNVSRWNGSSWQPVGAGLNAAVEDLVEFDDGTGPALFATGAFNNSGGATPVARIAKWDGAGWSALSGGGLNGNGGQDLVVFDDGTGPALFVGGDFTLAGGVGVGRIARWDGLAWSDLAGGVDAPVHSLAVYDDGSGPALYVGGEFETAGGVPVSHLARWDGAQWSAVGGGVQGFDAPFLTNSNIHTLAVHDFGDGPSLVAGGEFTVAGSTAARFLAVWNGESWRPLGRGFSASVRALATFDDGSGPVLFAGGTFESSPGGDSYLARWSCVPGTLRAPLRAE